MKFKDPLASLYFLGGVFPVHVAMALFSAHLWFDHINKIECPELTESDINELYKDVFWMFVAHCLNIIFFIMRKCFSKQTDSGTYFKTFFSYLSILVYLMAYLFLEYRVEFNHITPPVKLNRCAATNQTAFY